MSETQNDHRKIIMEKLKPYQEALAKIPRPDYDRIRAELKKENERRLDRIIDKYLGF